MTAAPLFLVLSVIVGTVGIVVVSLLAIIGAGEVGWRVRRWARRRSARRLHRDGAARRRA